MRFPIRSLATLVMMVGVATCSDTPIAGVKTGSSPSTRFGVGKIALAPVFSRAAQYAAAHLADFPTVRFDSVRVVIRGTPDTTKVIKDTTVFFDVNSAELQLDLDVPVQNDGQRFQAGMDYRGPSGVVFHGVQVVQSHRPDQPAPAQQPILIDYVGVGSNVKTITVAPRSVSLVGNQASTLTVTAVDANNNTIAVPLAFTSSNTSIATVSNSGLVQAQNRRGNATITVRTPSGVIDNATVSVSLTPSAIGVASGNGQTGRVGSTLANPAVVQVSASDGIGVPGVSVIFAAPTGGSVSPTTATTDANGRASTTMKLGPKAGPQGFTATAAGVSAAVNVTATPGDPSALTILSGNNQSDSVRATLAPLNVRVSDTFDNPIAGVTVSWSKTGGGSLGSATSTTNVDGIATNTYTLSTAIGTESVTAGAGTMTATFAFTVGGGRPASIVAVSGNGQTGKVSQSLANPLIVKVADAAGNPVRDAVITWTAQNATIASSTPSDAAGQASANVILGTTAGSASMNAAIPGGASVSFGATVQPGAPATMFFTAQPTSGVATLPLAPVRVALRDAGNNPADGTVTVALVNATNGAVLGGTLSQSTSNGVATFGNLTIDRVGAGYTLRASTNGLTATSDPFSATAGAAASLSIVAGNGATAKVNTAVATAPSVKLVDNANNPIVGASVTFSVAPGSGSIAPAGGIVTTDALGIATLSSWTLGTAVGTQTLRASASGVQPVAFTATALPGNAFKLVLRNKASLQGSVVAGSLLSPQPLIQLTDEFGNAVPAGQMQVNVSPTTDATVSGTTSMPVGATNGSATFSDLKLSGTGATKLVFRESSGQIKPDTSNAISIGAGTAAHLKIASSSSSSASISIVAGQAMSLPQAKVEDANGNPVAGVTIHIVVDSGTTSRTVVGVDSFTTNVSGLASINAPVATKAATYHVTATSIGILDTLRITATVTAAPLARLFFANKGSLQTSLVSGATLSPQPSIRAVDQYENPVPGVNVALTTSTSGFSIGGTSTLSLGTSGSASYSGITVAGSGSTQLVVSSGTLADTSNSITVSAATGGGNAATQIERYGGSSFIGIVGVSLATRPAVLVKDASGNPVANTAIVFALTPDTITIDGTRRADTVATNNLGIATMSVWKLPTRVGTYSLVARPATGSLTGSPVTFTASTLAGAVSQLTFVNGHGVPVSFENRSAYSNGPRLLALDAYDNPIAGVTIDASVSDASAPTSVIRRPGPSASFVMLSDPPKFMSDSSATTDGTGVADFGGVKFRGKIQSFRLVFIARGTTVMVATPTALRHGTMSSAICTASLPGRVGLGHQLSMSPKLKLIDLDSNIVDAMPVTLTSLGTLSSSSATSDANGEVTVSTWKVRGSAGDDSLRVNGVNGACHVSAADKHHIKLSLTSLGTKKNGDLIPSIDATVVDVDGNAIEDTTFTIDAVAHPQVGKHIFISKSKASNSRGKSTFDSLTVDAETQTGATLDFALSGAATVTGQITLDVSDGDASDLDNSDVANSALGGAGQDLDDAFTVNIRDHNKRNGLSGSAVQNVVVTWSSACSEVSFPNGNTSLTASNGRATSPRIHLGSAFAGPCTVTARAILAGVATSVDFTIRQ